MNYADLWKLALSCSSSEEFSAKLAKYGDGKSIKQAQSPNLAIIAASCKTFSEFQRKMAILEGRE